MVLLRDKRSLKSSESNILDRASYDLGRSNRHVSAQHGLKELFATQQRVLIALAISLSLLTFCIFSPNQPWVREELPNQQYLPPANFHVLIPASEPNVNLCKLLISAAILGYPTPAVINFDETFDTPGLVEGGSHLAKISGIYEYIDHLDQAHDDDLVLMVDGYDVWFQLRPQILINRYFELNRQANQRIEQQIGIRAAQKHSIRQDIIFGCQKRCWPWEATDPPCYAVPNSTLPTDIYGSRTDTLNDDENNPYSNYRPRFLVSGTAMGTVKGFRKLFTEAKKRLEHESNFGSDQYIFSHIFGDQSVYREVVRRDEMQATDRIKAWHQGQDINSHFNEKHIDEVRQKAAEHPDGNFEFGIGIDYGNEIVLNTVFAEDDTAWLRFHDKSTVREALDHHEVPQQHRAESLSKDVASSLPPFWTFTQENVPRWAQWEYVALLTNIFNGVQPAVIHHNAHRDGLKSRRETWWDKIWFQSNARLLLDASIYAPVTPVATSGYDEKSQRQWWPHELWKGGVRKGIAKIGKPGDGWLRLQDLCRDYHEELFRDEKGEWVLPDSH